MCFRVEGGARKRETDRERDRQTKTEHGLNFLESLLFFRIPNPESQRSTEGDAHKKIEAMLLLLDDPYCPSKFFS
jgi:hypothetical protein